jgi:hypothetical protein
LGVVRQEISKHQRIAINGTLLHRQVVKGQWLKGRPIDRDNKVMHDKQMYLYKV